MTDSIDDMLDSRMSGAGEYPDWWEPEAEGDQIQGTVVEVRDDPWAEEEDREPAKILEIHTDDGEEYSTRPHSVLDQLIKTDNVEEKDYVRIEYKGAYRTNSGNMANNYELGVVKSDELEEVGTDGGNGGATAAPTPSSDTGVNPDDFTVAELESEIEDITDIEKLDEIRDAEENGADRKSVYSVIDRRRDEIMPDDDELSEAGEFADNILSYYDDELEISELDKYLNSVRGFDVDPEDVADEIGAEIEDDVVIQ